MTKNKTRSLQIYVSEKLFQQVQDVADYREQTISDYLRDILDNTAKRHWKALEHTPKFVTRKLIKDTRKLLRQNK